MLNVKNIKDLSKKQEKLDSFIINNNNSTDVISKNKFALKIEVYEFINEIGAHKHWKKKKYDENKVQEELIDILHFTLFFIYKTNLEYTSKELNSNNDIIKSNIKLTNKNELFEFVQEIEKQFLNCMEKEDFIMCLCLIDYLNDLLFKTNIFDAYDKKYQINVQRQLEKY